MNRWKNPRHRLSCLAVLPALALVLLASGCLWGVVRDAETGDGLAGVTVTYTDADGNSASTTTGAGGLYAFNVAGGPIPVVGTADFEITAAGYHTKTTSRVIAYDDNPGASLSNPSSFWEVQSFTLQKEGAQSIEVTLVSVDISHAALDPWWATTDSIVAISAYDPDDPGGSLCHEETGWLVITSADPPPRALTLKCSVPGDTLEVRVYVGVRNRWADEGGDEETHDNSTAGFSWEAPSLTTGLRTATLNSADAAGPDDPDLSFTASLRYRSVED